MKERMKSPLFLMQASKNNLTGIPIFFMGKSNVDYNFYHGMAIGFAGDDPSNPNNKTIGTDDISDPYDYTFIEPQSISPNGLSKISQSNHSIPNTKYIVKNIKKWLDSNGCYYNFNRQNLLEFQINQEGKPELIYQNPNLIETREQAMDIVYPLLTVTTPQQDSTYNTNRTPLNFSVTDNHFDRSGYCINNTDTTWQIGRASCRERV